MLGLIYSREGFQETDEARSGKGKEVWSCATHQEKFLASVTVVLPLMGRSFGKEDMKPVVETVE